MKNSKNLKAKLLEKAPLVKLYDNLRTFYMLTNRNYLLPYPFYKFLEFYRLFVYSMCLLLIDIPHVWDDNIYLKRIFKFVQIFYRFSSISETKESLEISFIVILVLFFVIELAILGIFIKFEKTSTISEISSYITCFLQEIVFQVLFLWVSSQTATVMALIITDSNFRGTFEYVQLAIYLFLFVYYFVYSFLFLNNDILYMKGRTIAWSNKLQQLCIFTVFINLFLTRLVELLPKLPSIIIAVITMIIIVVYVCYLYYYLPYIDLYTNTLYISFSISFLMGLFLQLIARYVHYLDVVIVLIVILVITLILIFVNNKINRSTKRKANDLLNSLASDEILFESAFKNGNSFLKTVRLGFTCGNLYIFTWKPFLNAIDTWPNDYDIRTQLIRFIVIYPEEESLFENIINKYQGQNIKNMMFKSIISQAKFIIKSRNKHMNKYLKQDLKLIDEDIMNIKTVVITYWNEISGGSSNSNSIYNIASKLKDSFDNMNSQYLRLISLYPNNYSVASKYSDFELNIVSDPVKSKFWKQRSIVLQHKSRQILTDSAKEYGSDLFPFIPKNIHNLSDDDNSANSTLKFKNNQNNQNNQVIENSILIIDNEDKMPLKNENSNNENKNDTKSESSNCSVENNEIQSMPSNFRKQGLNAKLPFINAVIIISVVFLIISFICVPFIPPLIIVSKLNFYKDQFKVLVSICDIRTSLMTDSYYMFFHALRYLNEMLAAYFQPYATEALNKEILKLNSNFHFFQNSLGTIIKKNSLAYDYIKNTKIKLIYDDKTFNASFWEAISTMTTAVFHHDNPDGAYFYERWFVYIFNNIDNVEHALGSLAQIFCDDMNNYRDDVIKMISVLLYIFLGIEIIIIPFFVYFTLKIRKNWNYIINTINSIPRAAIQNVIQKYSNANSKNSSNNQNFKSEFRYQLAITQMVSSRDTSGGLPLKSIIIVFVIDLIISIACIIAIIQIMDISKSELTNIPMQYYTGTDGIYAIHKFITVFLVKGYIDFLNAVPVITGQSQLPIFTSRFGIYDHFFLYQGVQFTAEQMIDTLTKIIFGTVDFPQKGVLYSTKEIVNMLTEINGNLYGYNDTMTELNLENFPHFAGFEFFYESNLKFIEQIIANPYFNCIIAMVLNTFNMGYIFDSVKLGTFSIVPIFLDTYVLKTNELFNDKIKNIYMILFLIGSAIFVVGIIAITWLIVMIVKVKKVIQFSLSMFSMVDPTYVQEMQNIMNLFNGKTDGIIQTNNDLQRIFNEVESLVPECPLELNSQMHIVSISNKLIEKWGLDAEQANGSHISLILNFNDESILNELTNQANGIYNKKKPKHYNTQITIEASKKVIDVSFTSYHIPKNKDIKLVLMFDSNLDGENKEVSIDEMIEKNKDLKVLCIPESLRDKIDVNSDNNNRFISRYLIFAAIELLNVDEFTENHSPNETLKFYKNFENKIKEMCDSKDKDSIYLKKIGNIFIIGFNFIQQITNFYQSTQNACSFVKEINEFAISNQYVIRSCMVSAKSATSLLISKNTLKFDVYSNKIKAMLSLLKSAQKFELIIQSKMKDFMAPNIESEIEEVEIARYNMEPEWGYKINYGKL